MNQDVIDLAERVAEADINADESLLAILVHSAKLVSSKLRGFGEDESYARMLGSFCEHKAAAIGARRAGRTQAAMDEERAADRIYNNLPHWVRVW
jgi:hypothetical protein